MAILAQEIVGVLLCRKAGVAVSKSEITLFHNLVPKDFSLSRKISLKICVERPPSMGYFICTVPFLCCGNSMKFVLL